MTKATKQATSVLPLSNDDVRRLRAALKAEGGSKRPLGLPPVTVARALAGYPVRAGTAALIRERVAAASIAS